MHLAVWLTMATCLIGTYSHRHAQCVRSQDHGRAAAHLNWRALPWLLMALSGHAGVDWQVSHGKLQLLATRIHSRADEGCFDPQRGSLGAWNACLRVALEIAVLAQKTALEIVEKCANASQKKRKFSPLRGA